MNGMFASERTCHPFSFQISEVKSWFCARGRASPWKIPNVVVVDPDSSLHTCQCSPSNSYFLFKLNTLTIALQNCTNVTFGVYEVQRCALGWKRACLSVPEVPPQFVSDKLFFEASRYNATKPLMEVDGVEGWTNKVSDFDNEDRSLFKTLVEYT